MKLNFKLICLSIFLGLTVFSCKDETINEYYGSISSNVVYDSINIPSDINEKGFFVLNEDWFGHDDGSINYFAPTGEITYRAYRKANPGEKFGVTSQFGTVYGENLYVTSKQGNRLVIADKQTLKKKAVLTEVGGDGRGFAGISPEKAYMGTSKGVSIIDLKDYTFVKTIDGISGEVGNIIYAKGYAFIVTHNNIVVVDAKTDALVKTLDIANPACMVQSKDGTLWVGSADKLTRIDPITLDYKAVKDISSCGIFPTWYAWTKGSLSASAEENVLYWATGTSSWSIKTIAKYDIDADILTPNLFSLGTESKYKISTENVTLDLYGAALNVNPLTNEIVLLVKRNGFGVNGSYNWLFILDNEGNIKKIITVGDDGTGEDSAPGKEPQEGQYYWFPSMPLFNDYYLPEILLNRIELGVGAVVQVNLDKVVYDPDTPIRSIDVKLELVEKNTDIAYKVENNRLIITADSATENVLKIVVNSNGNIVERMVPIVVKE